MALAAAVAARCAAPAVLLLGCQGHYPSDGRLWHRALLAAQALHCRAVPTAALLWVRHLLVVLTWQRMLLRCSSRSSCPYSMGASSSFTQ